MQTNAMKQAMERGETQVGVWINMMRNQAILRLMKSAGLDFARFDMEHASPSMETVPQSARVAVLANPADPAHERLMHNLTRAARALGLLLHVVEVRHADELDTAFAAMTQARVDALLVLEKLLLIDHLRGRLADLAAKSRLPAMYYWKMSVDAVGLMSYGPSLSDMQRRAATYVDKILKGAKPGDLPVEQPTTFELVINLKTVQALGLTLPPALLFQADEVIR
jgi:putative tryptophan/tyrosine transport system substrate-binding protein